MAARGRSSRPGTGPAAAAACVVAGVLLGLLLLVAYAGVAIVLAGALGGRGGGGGDCSATSPLECILSEGLEAFAAFVIAMLVLVTIAGTSALLGLVVLGAGLVRLLRRPAPGGEPRPHRPGVRLTVLGSALVGPALWLLAAAVMA